MAESMGSAHASPRMRALDDGVLDAIVVKDPGSIVRVSGTPGTWRPAPLSCRRAVTVSRVTHAVIESPGEMEFTSTANPQSPVTG